MQHQLTTEHVMIDSLSPYPDNPREGDIGAIAVSLEQNGQFRPIVVNRRDMTILAGNHTWKAAKYLGWPDIAVTFVDVDEQQARKIVLADNRHNDLASYNDDILAELLQQIVTGEGVEGLLGTGYDGDDLDDLLATAGTFDMVDQLADEYDGPQNSEPVLHLKVTELTQAAWEMHRQNFVDDDTALGALLNG